MSCDEFKKFLASGAPLNDLAEQHLQRCEACRNMMAALVLPAEAPDQERLKLIQKQIRRDWKPVRAFPSDATLISLLLALFICFCLAAALPKGYFGMHALSGLQMTLYYGVIVACALVGAIVITQEMIPGAKRRINPALALALSTAALVLLTAVLFPSFDTRRFVQRGLGCLRLGSICSFVCGVLFSFVLRQGFFTSPWAAATTAGFFCGLTGVSVLAIHCPLLAISHILVWHFGVLVIGVLAGAGIGSLMPGRVPKRKPLRA